MGVSRPRQYAGAVLAVAGSALLVAALWPARGQLNLASDLLVFIVLVVAVALVGGLLPALLAVVLATLCLNFWFTAPVQTLSIHDPNNVIAIIGFALIAGMVSWIVDLAARRQQAAADAAGLAAGNRLRTALLAAVGHDLRTPLAAAKASVSALCSPGLSWNEADRAALLENADDALDRLAGLVDNLLDLSRLQTGAMAMRVAPVPLDDVVARALDDLGAEGRQVVLELDDDLPPVLADAGLLERVIVNLVANAQRYSPAGRPPTLRAVAVGARVELAVIDHGPGIPPEEQEGVFVPFQRLGDGDAGSGIGLGLAVARGLTEAMGGSLVPRATPGGGLTMTATLRIDVGTEVPT